MKNAKKILSLLLCAVLLVGATIAGTVAYLTSQDEVTNTFTVGKVVITLDETDVDVNGVKDGDTRVEANTYKLIPGHTYTKDPTITVDSGSENCYIFVKIANGLGADADITRNEGWDMVSENGNTWVWVYGTFDDPVAVSAGTKVVPFNQFTFAEKADPTDHENSTITVTAYAIQADSLENEKADTLWGYLTNP